MLAFFSDVAFIWSWFVGIISFAPIPSSTTVFLEVDAVSICRSDPLLCRVTLKTTKPEGVSLRHRLGGEYETVWFEYRPVGDSHFEKITSLFYGSFCAEPVPLEIPSGKSMATQEMLVGNPSNPVFDVPGRFELRAVVKLAGGELLRSAPVELSIRDLGIKTTELLIQNRKSLILYLMLAYGIPADHIPKASLQFLALPDCNARKHTTAAVLLSSIRHAKTEQELKVAELAWEAFSETLDRVSTQRYTISKAKAIFARGNTQGALKLIESLSIDTHESLDLRWAIEARVIEAQKSKPNIK